MNSFLAFLDHWWNLPFLVMLLLVGAYFALQLLGLVGHAAHLGHHAHGHGRGGKVGHGGKGRLGGVARGAPFVVVWLSVCVFGGFTGLIVNRVVYLRTGGDVPAWLFPLSFAAAAIVALLGVTIAARAAARLVPDDGHGATSRRELVGTSGVVASAALDDRFGEVRVAGADHELLVHARIQADEPALAHGTRVVLVEYDDASELYWVIALPDAVA